MNAVVAFLKVLKKKFKFYRKEFLSNPKSPFSSYSKRRAWYNNKISKAASNNEIFLVEILICDMAKTQPPSTWAITFYIARVVNKGMHKNIEFLINYSKVREDHKPLLISAKYRYEGNIAAALQSLSFSSDSAVVRFKNAQAQRSIYHQEREFEKLAISSVEFMKNEPDMIFLDYAFNAAGTAEKCDREDLVAQALTRLLDDIKRVQQDRRLFKLHWREAARNAVKTFNILKAQNIVDKARKLKYHRSDKEYSFISNLRSEVSEWRWAINSARRALVDRAAGASEVFVNNDATTPVVLLHSAAFSRNKIDYPGFRRDIRFIYNTVFNWFLRTGCDFKVATKLSTHGVLRYKLPYVSYHTLSDGEFGLHFKETDRPSFFSFDPKGYSGWSSFSEKGVSLFNDEQRTPDACKKFFASDVENVIRKNVSKYSQVDTGELELPSQYVFVGLQIPGDAVQELCYMNAKDMLYSVVETCKSKNIPVVVKRHPYCKSPLIAKVLEEGVANGDFIVSVGNIHKLISGSLAVCVANSSVGAEALLHRKPVYVFGKSEYMRACFVCKKEDDFARHFEVDKMPITNDELEDFLFVFRNHYAISLKNRGLAKEKIENKLLRMCSAH